MRHRMLALATMVAMWLSGLAAPHPAAATPLRPSDLAGEALRSTRGGQVMKLQDVTGDSRVDLLLVRAAPEGDPPGQGRLEVWERRTGTAFQDGRSADGFFLALGSGLPAHALDVQGTYVPGGIGNAGRDLVVLQAGSQHNLIVLRNQGPGSAPRFAPLQRLSLPGGRRLQFPVPAPLPPASPNFVNLPMPITLDDGRIQVLRFDGSGHATLLAEPLEHPGGANAVLLVADSGGTTALVSLGAGPPLLWRVAQDTYLSSPLTLSGWPAGSTARQALLGDFDDDAVHADLIVAFDDGRTWRWDGEPPPDTTSPIAFAAPTLVTEGVQATALVELAVETDTPGALQRALLVAGSPASPLFVVDAAAPGRPFAVGAAQLLPDALGAFGDFGLDLLFVANRGIGVEAFRSSGGVGGGDGSSFSLGWRELNYAVLVGGRLQATVSTPLADDVARSYRLEYQTRFSSQWLPMRVIRNADYRTELGIVDTLIRLPAGTLNDVIQARRPPPVRPDGNDQTAALRLVETSETDTALIREPRQRVAHEVTTGCPRDPSSAAFCLFGCVDANGPPRTPGAAAAKASTGFFPADTRPLLHRLRDDVLRQSSKGREYVERYETLSLAMFNALLRRPSIISDYGRAHDAWLPAIRSLVDGDGSAVITAAMVEEIEVIAAHLAQDGDAALRQAVEREYALLDPRTLAGMSMTQLRARYESLPTERVFANSFEAAPPP
jgi:hypothetical protein